MDVESELANGGDLVAMSVAHPASSGSLLDSEAAANACFSLLRLQHLIRNRRNGL